MPHVACSMRRLIRATVDRLVGAGIVGVAVAVAGAPGVASAQYRGNISSIVLDAQTGNVVQQDQADLVRFPASLTKLMTLYMAFEALRDRRITFNEPVPVSDHAASREPSKLGLLPGSYLTVDQAVLALVTKSANDAASALGEMLGGDEDRFGQMMTLRARALGMSHTTFRNASGLPDPDQVTTASDLALLARHLIADFPDQYHYFAVPSFWFHGREIPNHDPMLRIYPGADGLKTGFTDAAGCNLVTSAVRGNVRLIGVVLGAQNNAQRSQVMAALLNQGFAQEGVPVQAPSFIPYEHGRRPTAMMVAEQIPAFNPVIHGHHVRVTYAMAHAPARARGRGVARAPAPAQPVHASRPAGRHGKRHKLMTALEPVAAPSVQDA